MSIKRRIEQPRVLPKATDADSKNIQKWGQFLFGKFKICWITLLMNQDLSLWKFLTDKTYNLKVKAEFYNYMGELFDNKTEPEALKKLHDRIASIPSDEIGMDSESGSLNKDTLKERIKEYYRNSTGKTLNTQNS